MLIPTPTNGRMPGYRVASRSRRTLKGTLQFRLVDLDGTRGVIWEHELYQNFDYFQDRPYFHSFPGDVRHRFLDLMYQR
jgi:hypothetical protein